MLRLRFKPISPVQPSAPRWHALAWQLACDEAMLMWAERVASRSSTRQEDTELLRWWQLAAPAVVLGRSSKIDEETHRGWCEANGVAIVRRCSGGASIVGGPGCWMYSVVLRLGDDQALRRIDAAHHYVIERVLAAVRHQLPEAERRGICDLTLGERKFSGNSLRVMRHHLLYHGTILTDADLDQIAACLDHAPRQPDYRRGRSHRDFIGNAPLDADRLGSDLEEAFDANRLDDSASCEIAAIAEELMTQRYLDPAWHTQR